MLSPQMLGKLVFSDFSGQFEKVWNKVVGCEELQVSVVPQGNRILWIPDCEAVRFAQGT